MFVEICVFIATRWWCDIRRCVIMPELKESPLSQIAVTGVLKKLYL